MDQNRKKHEEEAKRRRRKKETSNVEAKDINSKTKKDFQTEQSNDVTSVSKQKSTTLALKSITGRQHSERTKTDFDKKSKIIDNEIDRFESEMNEQTSENKTINRPPPAPSPPPQFNAKKELTLRRSTFSCQNTGKLDLSDFLLNEKYSDISLVSSDGQRLPGHRIVLASQSPVLARLIDSIADRDFNQSNRKHLSSSPPLPPAQESSLTTIELRQFNAEELQELMRYLYTGLTCNLRLPAERLLPLTDTLELFRLKDWCEEQLLGRISVVNTPDFLVLAEKCSARSLRSRLIDFLRQNAQQITQSDAWTRITETHPVIVADMFKYMVANRNTGSVDSNRN